MVGQFALEPCPKRHLGIGADLTAPLRLQASGPAVAVDIRAPGPVQEGRVPSAEGENEAIRVSVTPPRIARVVFRLQGVGKRISGRVHHSRNGRLWARDPGAHSRGAAAPEAAECTKVCPALIHGQRPVGPEVPHQPMCISPGGGCWTRE